MLHMLTTWSTQELALHHTLYIAMRRVKLEASEFDISLLEYDNHLDYVTTYM